LVDSCLAVPQANCDPEVVWQCGVWDVDVGYYCWPCSGGECSCDGGATQVEFFEGLNAHYYMEGCNWGTVVPGGQCYCLYDEQTPGEDTFYACWGD
jgi:hypothetical protein